jgi:hypothetical protein
MVILTLKIIEDADTKGCYLNINRRPKNATKMEQEVAEAAMNRLALGVSAVGRGHSEEEAKVNCQIDRDIKLAAGDEDS